ncbi:helix-turn-helix transcriptional regulator [Natrarchaeobius oligotrophus]|nr:helix-turn-helix transcriptional regulator [Natrarchaeobius chitinivorans]
MRPPTELDGDDTWHVLQVVTEESRANIVADVVGHPKGAPSVDELARTNPSLQKDTIRGHLSVLKNANVVEERVVPVGQRTRGYPYKFYQLTDDARELFDRNGLFPEDSWTRQYDRLEKDPELRELEAMPRPDPGGEPSDRSEGASAD